MIKPDEFKRYLKIDKTALDDEIVEQPMLFFQVSEAMAQAAAERDALKEALASVDAKLDNEVRVDLEKGGERVTEATVKANIQTDKRHKAAFDSYLAAKTRADVLLNLKDAFQQRGYMIRDLVQLFVTGYFQNSSVKTTGATDEFLYTSRREQLAKLRELEYPRDKKIQK